MHRSARTCVASVVVIWACGGSSSGEGPTDPPGGGNNNPNVTVTLVARSIDPAAEAGQLYMHVGDAALTRAGMASVLNENAPALRYVAGSNRNSTTVQVPKGKVVTVFAVEFGTGDARYYEYGQTVVKQAPPTATEFISFESSGQAPGVPESGVAVFTATSDVTITANFDRMMGTVVAFTGCLDIRLQVTGPGNLTFGPAIPDPAPDLTTWNGFVPFTFRTANETPEELAFVWGKQLATITLRARQYDVRSSAPNLDWAGFIRWEGAGALCSTGLNCQMQVPARATSVGVVRQINGWIEDPSSLRSIACGSCPPGKPGCTHRP